MNEPALIPTPLTLDVFRVGEIMVKSGYFTDVRDASQAIVKILAGAEIGIGPLAAISGVYIQNGKPTYSANIIAAAIKKSKRYDYRVKLLTAIQCDLEFFENGKSAGVSSFTMKDAETAGLLAGRNVHSWKHYPKNMLFARALTNGARFYAPDVFGGQAPYSPEELDVEVDGESGEAITTPPTATVAPPAKPTLMEKLSGDPKPLRLGKAQEESKPTFTHTPEPPPSATISEAQRRRLFALLKVAQVEPERFKDWLISTSPYHYASTKDIALAHYDGICEAITNGMVTAVPFDYATIIAKARITRDEFEAFVRAHFEMAWKDLGLAQRVEITDQLESGYITQWCVDNGPREEQVSGS